jgi:hypothetical protein
MVVYEISIGNLPPEIASCLGISKSVLDTEITRTALTEVRYWVAMAIVVAGVVASIGLCFGQRWGRTLYLLTFVAALVDMLMTDFSVSTGGAAAFLNYLVGTTEGMIVGLAYFSHIRRMFQASDEI